MKKLSLLLLFTCLPTGAFAWAGYDYVPFTVQEQADDSQEVASFDPAMVPLDMADVSDSDATTEGPLDAD